RTWTSRSASPISWSRSSGRWRVPPEAGSVRCAAPRRASRGQRRSAPRALRPPVSALPERRDRPGAPLRVRPSRQVGGVPAPAAAVVVAGAPDPMFVADRRGRVLLANKAAAALLGVAPGESLDPAGGRFVSADEGRQFIAGVRSVVELGTPYSASFHIRDASGEPVLTLLTAAALHAAPT